jgi:DNA-directed RNA polymerase specialized sigma24 family protein
MPPTGPVTLWIGLLKAGDPAAAQPIWEGYYRQLVRLARARLRSAPRRAADEEDVALSAFNSFCRGAEQGRFPRLEDRNALWQLLVVLTARKALELVKHERRLKRGGGRVFGESDRAAGDGPDLAGVIGAAPTPEFAAQVAEECERLLVALGDEGLRAVAVAKMEGFTNVEIADRLGCVPRTVERRLALIRSLWAAEAPP